MEKLVFKAYIKKLVKYFFWFYFLYIKILTAYFKKTKKIFEKKLVKGTKIFLKKKKTKSSNILLSHIEKTSRGWKTKISWINK